MPNYSSFKNVELLVQRVAEDNARKIQILSSSSFFFTMTKKYILHYNCTHISLRVNKCLIIEYLSLLCVIYLDIFFFATSFVQDAGHSVKSADLENQSLLSALCAQHTSKYECFRQCIRMISTLVSDL